MDWWSQHSKNGYTTKSNIYVQCNSHQNLNDIHHRYRKIYPTVHLETQETMNSQGNTQQKEQFCRYHNTQLQTTLQTHSNKNNMVLAQKQIWGPVKQNRGLRIEIWIHTVMPTLFLTKAPKTYKRNREREGNLKHQSV
jgi:hypothetical protein